MPLKTTHTFFRAHKRIPMEIPVMLGGHRRTPGTESTFTENVSARGARVVSVRNWEKGEHLTLGHLGAEDERRRPERGSGPQHAEAQGAILAEPAPLGVDSAIHQSSGDLVRIGGSQRAPVPHVVNYGKSRRTHTRDCDRQDVCDVRGGRCGPARLNSGSPGVRV